NQTTNAVTDLNGFFQIPKPTSPSLTRWKASVVDSRDLITQKKSGISGFDQVLLQKHITGVAPLDCPIQRLAADFNQDGQLDQTDLDLMTQLILTVSYAYPLDTWQLIPNLSTHPTIQHPDLQFSGAFWNDELPSKGGKHYPFDANLQVNGSSYSYNRGSSDSWMNQVDNWLYDENAICSPENYGFWLIKVGDVNFSAEIDPTFDPPLGGNAQGNPQLLAVSGNGLKDIQKAARDLSSIKAQSTEVDLRSTTTSADQYRVKVSVQSAFPLDAYQLGLKLDPSALRVMYIMEKENAKLQQKMDKNYNTNPTELSQGNIRTLYLTSIERGKVKSIDITEWTEILELEVDLMDQSMDMNQALNKINLDALLMEPEFISGDSLINNNVQMRIELVKI
ncbi:MAG: hypothetical protein AAF242_18155, partial [Bacteroidota bacterium]